MNTDEKLIQQLVINRMIKLQKHAKAWIYIHLIINKVDIYLSNLMTNIKVITKTYCYKWSHNYDSFKNMGYRLVFHPTYRVWDQVLRLVIVSLEQLLRCSFNRATDMSMLMRAEKNKEEKQTQEYGTDNNTEEQGSETCNNDGKH